MLNNNKMNRLIIPLFALLIGCQTENSEKMNYILQNIEIGDDKYEIKVPKEEVYKTATYDATQAAKMVHLNLERALKEKLSSVQLEMLLNFQAEYLNAQQQLGSDFTAMDENNVTFLKEKTKIVDMNLSKEEIITIFDVELFYLKLINIIE